MLRQAGDQAAGILADAQREADAIVIAGTRAAPTRPSRRPGPRAARKRPRWPPRNAAEAAAEARSVLLELRSCERCGELRSQVRAAVGGLRGEPGYGRLLDRLTTMARRAAGPDAAVEAVPGGGVSSRGRAGVVVDCSLPRLADLAVAALGPGRAGAVDAVTAARQPGWPG